MKILLCMATGHNVVNTMPLESTDVRPDLVYVAATKDYAEKAQELITDISSMGIKTKKLEIPNEESLQELIQYFEAWLFEHDQDDIIVNITGGTKLMTLAAYQVFHGYGLRCFYQIHSKNQIIWLDDEQHTETVGHKMSLERYLAQYQFKIRGSQNLKFFDEPSLLYVDEIFKELKTNYDRACKMISQINFLATDSISAQHKKDAYQRLTPEQQAFLDHLAYTTKLFKVKHDGLYFSHEQHRSVAVGGWLEILTAQMLKQAANTRDLSVNVQFDKSTKRVGAASLNEIDVMAMIGAKLHLAECKTINWEGRTGVKAEDSIYKLSALSDIGGLNTRSVFVSLYDVTGYAKTRAAENNIYLICGRDLIGLASLLRQWAAS